MRNPPPEVIASWPKPNYVNPEFQGPQLAVVGITLMMISIIIVSLRMFVRFWMRRSASWDDWLMIMVMPILVAATALSIVSTKYGWGIHIWDNKKEWFRPSRIASWASELLYITIMVLLKTSILVSYLRFFKTRTYRFLTWTMIGVMMAWFISYTVTLLFNCSPFWEYWNPHPGNKCISEIGKLLSAAITNVITDLIILLLPIPTFWTLRLPPREKITLIVLMSLGLTACIAAAIKTRYIYKAVLLTYDVTWEGYNVWLWSDIEINLAVVSPSVPVLRPFAQKYLPLLGFKSLYQPSEGTPADYRNRKVVYRQDTIQQIIGDTYDDDSSTKALDLAPSLIAMTSSKRSRGFSNDRP